MITRVGVVGPRDSVNLICEVGKEFEDQLIIVPFIYQDIEETREIIRNGERDIDVWLFSGQAPYAIAKETITKQKAFFPQLNGSSLTKVLLEMVYRDKLRLERVSFDTISIQNFHETCTELDLTYEQMHLLSYSGFKSMDELISFHTTLFRTGKVDACATCLHSVYEELKANKVPVYRITPNRMTIRSMLKLAKHKGETLHFKKSQIAIQVIEIEAMDKLIGENKSSYDVHRLDLRLQGIILDYVEALSGSIVALGNGKYIVFSTRGSFEENKGLHTSALLEKMALLTDLNTNVGIGFGITALAAERNAQLALLHAKKIGGFSAILVNDEGLIEGPLQKPDSITFHYRNEDKEISQLLKKAGVTITTFNKILSVQKNMGQNSVSASDIAEWLGMTQRNARRILSDLEQHKLAQLIGEEAPTSRGRPRKIYRINQITKQT